MPSNDGASLFLPNGQAVLAAIRDTFAQDPSDYLYVSGSAVKFIINGILENIPKEKYKNKIYITLPALTGKDFTNSSFLYQINNLASKIRISSKAMHNIVLTADAVMLLSVANSGKNMDDDQICGVCITGTSEHEKVRSYCHDLWASGFPLHLG